MFEIHGERANAQIALDEPRRCVDIFVLSVVAEGIEPAFARFDLDDFCAVPGQQPTRIRTCIAGSEGENSDAF